MDEFSFIDSIKPSNYRQSSLIKGVDDDAAVFRQNTQEVVTAVDTMVDGVHFSRETMAPFYVGYRALAANLSDLAAMGAVPAFYLVSIVISSDWEEHDLREIYRGMSSLADDYQMDMIGGDTVSGKELVLSITVIGYVDRNRARYRTEARSGDVLFVTGTLGDSRAGFECIVTNVDNEYLINRHRLPTPRVIFSKNLNSIDRVALNDVSDGIASESNEIAEASGVDIHIAFSDLPYCMPMADLFPDQYEDWILSGGEDFELLGAVSESEWGTVQKAAERSGIAVTKIGLVTESKEKTGRVYLSKKGQTSLLKKSGYTHLQEGRD
ncbi:thiamine-phosphate kinase [Halobacillus shinanisalinarum]|uniref:Thiamine-monophosphate kinase n=1 Tax=Halobacillus shinanisalinarum TaxID=2932258 RepID=A0ABY4GUH8_9BACI|nr:thiamine-phosphate kinase [Halobacillus shinanisalinarum]UOQ91811.1 thiamine-phosphate kinase [Halobacillus shinanisalinarum]